MSRFLCALFYYNGFPIGFFPTNSRKSARSIRFSSQLNVWQGPFHGIGFTSGTGPCYFFSWLKLSLNVGRKTYGKLVFAISSSKGSSPLLVFMLYLSAPKTNIGSILAAPSEEKSLHRSSPKPTETNFLSPKVPCKPILLSGSHSTGWLQC